MLATAWAVSLSGAGGLDFGKELLKRRRMVRSSTCGAGHRSSAPFATLNYFPDDLGAPRESATRRVGIKGAPRWRQSTLQTIRSALVAITPRTDIVRDALNVIAFLDGHAGAV